MNFRNASYPKRFVAFFIDWYISSLFASIPVVVIQSIQGKDLIILNRLDDLTLPYAWTAGSLSLIIYMLYYCVMPLHTVKNQQIGQTFGRQLMKIRLTTIDGSPLSFKYLFIRDFICVLLLQGYLTSSNIYILSLIQMTTHSFIVPYFQSFYYATVILSLLMLLIGKKKQMLHDTLSKTRMIEAS